MRLPRAGGELFDRQMAVLNDDGVPGFETLDALATENPDWPGRRFRWRRQTRTFDGIAQGPDPQRIAGHEHVPSAFQETMLYAPSKRCASGEQEFHDARLLTPESSRQIECIRISGIGFARQMKVPLRNQLFPQLG